MNSSDQDLVNMTKGRNPYYANSTDIPYDQNLTNLNQKSQETYKDTIKKIHQLLKSDAETFPKT